ncbi:MAG: lysophospholipid acyltransferase family protein [Planctomycetaceae bacterium]
MSTENQAQLVLASLAALALVAVLLDIRKAGSFGVWFLARSMRVFTLLRYNQRMLGPCPLPEVGGALIVANHRSPVDPVLMWVSSFRKREGMSFRIIEYLTAAEYCELGGLVGWVTGLARVIPVARNGQDTKSAKESLRRLRDGHVVGIYPEGGINLGKGLREFNSGVGWLALRGNQPVYPVYIRNAPQANGMVASFLISQPADVIWGEPIDLSRWADRKPTAEVLEEVTEHLKQSVARLAYRRPLRPGMDAERARMPRPACIGCSGAGCGR